jgi:glycosyl transferase family 25
MRCFLINLDRSSDRLAHMQTEFARAGMDFERFPAVDGTDLPQALKSYFCDASDKIISPLRPGEIGCYASHLAIWQKMAAGTSPVLVCEDDISLPDHFQRLLEATLSAAPAGWDVVRLSSPSWRPVAPLCDLDGTHKLVRYWREPTLTGATLVSPQGARKLLKPGLRTRPVDVDLRRPWVFGIETFGVWPPPVTQDVHPSIILATGARHRYRRRLSPDSLWRHLHSLRTLGVRTWIKCTAQRAIRHKPAKS